MGPGESYRRPHANICASVVRFEALVLPATAALSGYFAGHIYQPNIKRHGAAVSLAASCIIALK